MDHKKYTKCKEKVKNRTWFSEKVEQVVVIDKLGGSAKVSAQPYYKLELKRYTFS